MQSTYCRMILGLSLLEVIITELYKLLSQVIGRNPILHKYTMQRHHVILCHLVFLINLPTVIATLSLRETSSSASAWSVTTPPIDMAQTYHAICIPIIVGYTLPPFVQCIHFAPPQHSD